uniref:Uncharacterized protein n=1 Tax=Rangifer tarandus platyrhynchus TaxID=3082113 RepID=A0ACB0F3D1_RANTA|nr:unnamed protein product [Rangifer tarandus platyrhynchus]
MSGSSWPRAAASCCQLELGPASEATSVRQSRPILTPPSLLQRRIVPPSVGFRLNPHPAGGSPGTFSDHPPAGRSLRTLRPAPPSRAFLSPKRSPLASLAPTSPPRAPPGQPCTLGLGKRPEDSSPLGSPSLAPQPGHGAAVQSCSWGLGGRRARPPQATAGELLFPGGRKEVSAPRRLRAPRQPLFSPRALASRGPGRQRFVPAGHPHLLGLPLLGSGSLAPCPTSSPLGAQDEAPGMA